MTLFPIVPPHVSAFGAAFAFNLSSIGGQFADNVTIVEKVFSGGLARTGNIVKVRMRASTAGPVTVSACYIGLAATSGDAWNFASSPTQLTWSGSSSVTLTADLESDSDQVAFAVTGASIAIAMNITALGWNRFRTGLSSDYVRYFKSGVSEAASTTKGASYTATSGRLDILSALLVA